MIRFLSKVPIFRRIAMAFALAALLPGILIVLLGNFYINSFDARGQAVRTSFDAQSLASQEDANLQRMNALLQAKFYQIFASHSHVITDFSLIASGGLVDGEIRALEADFSRNLTIYQSQYELATAANMDNVRSILLGDDSVDGNAIIQTQQDALDHVIGTNQAWSTYQSSQDQEASQLESLQVDLQNGVLYTPKQINQKYLVDYSILHSAILAFTDLKNNWQKVVDATVNMGKAVTSIGNSQIQPIYVATAMALVLTLLVVLLTGYMVNRTITRPLGQLVSLTERIAKGNTTDRAMVGGTDEIAKVANAMNAMLNHIVHLLQSTQGQRDALQARVEKLVSEVSSVAEGDLRIQAEVTNDILGTLADSFNYMVEELSNLVVQVKIMAHEVENSTSQTFQSIIRLVDNADGQIQQIGKASQEVGYMANTSRQVAECAQSLHVIADQTRIAAQNGQKSVQKTVEGIDRINTYVQDTSAKVQALGDSSREIDNIVGVISTIAHQTNRLALDAAVQAATAGENGKGFGAVAADIRRLAERAKDQASIIARIVRIVGEDIDAAALSMKDTERETSTGAKLAEETDSALASIFNVIELQGGEIERINQMATHQLQSSNSVVQMMQSVSALTQQSNASTRGVTRNMESLAHVAEQLLTSVEAFKLPENVDYQALSRALLSENKEYNHFPTVSGAFRTMIPATPVTRTDQYGSQPQYPQSNDSRTVDSYPQRNNSGPIGPQNLYPQRSNSGPIGPQSQNRIKPNRLQRPPMPPERQ